MKTSEIFNHTPLSEGRGNGVEYWTIHNVSGHPKKFKKIDGWWEHPVEVERWMKSSEIPEPKVRASVVRLQKAHEKFGSHVPADMALRWLKDDEENEREERRAARELKANRPKPEAMVNFALDAFGSSFPDGDPIDQIGPYLKKHGLEFSDLNAAFQKIHKKTYYQYLADMWDDYAQDALADAKQGAYGEHYDDQWFAQGNPWK